MYVLRRDVIAQAISLYTAETSKVQEFTCDGLILSLRHCPNELKNETKGELETREDYYGDLAGKLVTTFRMHCDVNNSYQCKQDIDKFYMILEEYYRDKGITIVDHLSQTL